MRDKAIDGFRAVAALGVVFAHLVSYRLGNAPGLHYAQKLAEPLAQTSVQIFFVISGFIITSLLIRERETTGRISIPAFYVRRVCRIIPPLFVYLLTVFLLGVVDGRSLALASTFTCNIGDCHWYAAHTWSLSVEEQYYLVWPMLLVALNPQPKVIALMIGALLVAFLIAPFAWHSNYISFTCIGMGALVASSKVRIKSNTFIWLATVFYLTLAPLYLPPKAALFAPALIAYLLFGAPAWVKAVLATKPFQLVGMASYSLYLWQQLFLGKAHIWPLWLLPVVVALSVVLVEQPYIKLGRRLSSTITGVRREAIGPGI